MSVVAQSSVLQRKGYQDPQCASLFDSSVLLLIVQCYVLLHWTQGCVKTKVLAVCTMRGPCVRLLSGPNRPAHRLHQDPAIRTPGWGDPTTGATPARAFSQSTGCCTDYFHLQWYCILWCCNIAYSGIAHWYRCCKHLGAQGGSPSVNLHFPSLSKRYFHSTWINAPQSI